MMEIAFYFICIAFYILKNGLLRKLWLVSNFMTSQIGQQIIKMHILSNITRSKGNQTMKFSQLIYYEKREIYEITWEFFFFFLKNLFQNVLEKVFLGPFIKSQNWVYLWTNCLKCYKVCFYCTSTSRSTKIC